MSCNKYTEYIIPYAEGTLSTTIMEEMAAHISACSECQHELDEIIDTIGILKETEYPQMEPPINLRSRVLAQIADESSVRKPWRRMNLSALSAAAGLLFICVFMVIYSRGGGPGAKSMMMEEAIKSSVVSSGSASAPHQETKSAAVAAPMTSVPGKASESHQVASGSISTTVTGKSLSTGNKPANTRSIEKPVMMAKIEPGNRLKDATADQMYMPEKLNSLDNTPTMTKPGGMPGAPGGIAKQRPSDDRQMYNAMIPGGAQNQQQNSTLNTLPEQNNLQENTSKSGFAGSIIVDKAMANKKRADEDILTLERKLAAFPNSITVMKKLLDGYRTAGRVDDEYAIALKLTQVDPNNAEYWFARGQAAEGVKMPKTAVTCYQTAIKKNLSGANLELAKSRLQALGK